MGTLLCLIYLFGIYILFGWDEIIDPVTQNATTEHYISSLTTSPEIRYNVIQCQLPICIVTCDTNQGCHQSTINASLSNMLTLNCIHPDSCQFGDVIGSMNLTEINCLAKDSCSRDTFDLDNTMNVNINCLNSSACSYSDINMNNTVNVNIKCENPICKQQQCNGSPFGSCIVMNFNAIYAGNVNIQCIESWACYRSIFNVNYSNITTIGNELDSVSVIGIGITTKLDILSFHSYLTNIYCPTNAHCNLICNGTLSTASNGCRVLKVYTTSNNLVNNNYFDLECTGSGTTSCELMSFQCNMNINDGFSKTIIDDTDGLYKCTDYDCCPFIYNKTVIYCPINHTNCIINCDASNQCQFKFIEIMDGSITKSVTINCDTASSVCQGLNVVINKQIESFTINCLSSSSCQYMSLDVNVITSVSVICNSSPYSYSCSESIIVINGTSITNINIDTSGLSRSELTIDNANYLNISCGDRGCDFLNVVAPNINSIHIMCNGSYSCYISSWYINVKNAMVLSCIDNYACDQSIWNIIANNVIIKCPSTVQNSECSRVNVNGNISNSLVITATNNDTIYGPFGIGTSSVFASNVNVSCGDCINIYKCSQNITFYCGDGSSFISNDECLNCECTDRGYNSFITTNNIWNECVPTPEPTVYPSTEPTTEPTINPTVNPTKETSNPTIDPTFNPTNNPTVDPTSNPTNTPTNNPTNIPTDHPTNKPTTDPTNDPTMDPTTFPTTFPTHFPTQFPTTSAPTDIPTSDPTVNPIKLITSIVIYKPSIITTTRIHAAESDSSSTEMTSIIIWLIIGFIVLVIIMAGIYRYAKSKSNNNNHKTGNKNIEKKSEQIYNRQQMKQQIQPIQPMQQMVMLPPQQSKRPQSQQIVMVQMPDGRMVSAKLMDQPMQEIQGMQHDVSNVEQYQQIPAYNPNVANIEYDEGEGGKGEQEGGITNDADIYV